MANAGQFAVKREAVTATGGRFTVNRAAVTQSEDQDSVKVGPPPRVETRG